MAPFLLTLAFALLVSKNGSPTKLIDKINKRKEIREDENAILFPTLSRRFPEFSFTTTSTADEFSTATTTRGGWIVPIHGWIYEPEETSIRRRALLSMLRTALDLKKEEEASSILSRRLRPFLVDNERGKRLTVEIVGTASTDYVVRKRMPGSEKNGHFRGILRVTDEELDMLGYDSSSEKLTMRLVQPSESKREFIGRTHLLPPKGLSVISDIDDTIKLSDVRDKRKLMRHTFLDEFQPVPGMSSLYQRWKVDHGAAFHFVSSSPYQLYGELSNFMERENFPLGSYHLKSVRIKDIQLLLNLLKDPFERKVQMIGDIVSSYPDRTFLLVGDTGEKDPEVYGEICRRYPGRVWKVYLRKVAGKQGIDTCSTERFDEAFRDVQSDVWSIFDDATQVSLPALPE
jgi:hypothetical protein